MTVRELIALLQTINPDLTVVCDSKVQDVLTENIGVYAINLTGKESGHGGLYVEGNGGDTFIKIGV